MSTINSSSDIANGTDENSPDLEEILRNFGIVYENLNPVPLHNYQWWSFTIEDNEHTTISQRIRFIRRRVDVHYTSD